MFHNTTVSTFDLVIVQVIENACSRVMSKYKLSGYKATLLNADNLIMYVIRLIMWPYMSSCEEVSAYKGILN